MKPKLLFLFIAVLLMSCANYKQLKPDPELLSTERGYTELMKGDKNFKLKQDKRYFISFPAPQENNYYLVLEISDKQKFNSFLTASLKKKKQYGEKIKDESFDPKKMSVYPIDKSAPLYYWLVDNVKEDLLIKLKYRYVPQWRFKFENKHAEYKDILAKNRIDRSAYKTLGVSYHFEKFNFKIAMDTIAKHTEELNKVLKQLLAIESIFPPGIVNSTDEAYMNYKKLKNQLEEEIKFHISYMMVLDFFNKENETQGNPAVFIDYVEDFIKYFSQKKRHPKNVIKESQTLLNKRLNEIIPFYEQRLSGKEDENPFDRKMYKLKEFYRIGTLYETSGLPTPKEFTNLSEFINGFDKRSKDLHSVKKNLNKIYKVIKKLKKMPSDAFFGKVVSKTSDVQKGVPQPMEQEYGKYLKYNCTKTLNEAIAQFGSKIETNISQYKEADTLVQKVNVFKKQQDYKGMLTLLKPKMHLGFLMVKYKEVDQLSVQQQDREIRKALADYHWAKAEAGLERLHHDITFLNPPEIYPLKERFVRELEDSIYITIDRVSRYRVNKFLEEKVDTLENIDSLYTDSVFLPAYDVTFSTGSKRELIQRKNDLVAHLAKMKEDEFPRKAVKILYEQFIKNPNYKGVAMARAIVRHGDHYKGEDKKTKRRIAECNPWSSKWIVKTKQYRKVYALPITDSKRGTNRYFLRLNIRIPTEAKFPVYDINIKLPKEIAKNAATSQWFEKITLNKNPIKSEGRFTITAPSADNNYECQITPVRMKKDKNNFLDIYFKQPSFKVYTISVMAQKPIIKKH